VIESRIRFNTVFLSNKIHSDKQIKELKEWSEKFQKNGLTPVIRENYTGNLSYRSKEGFIITASGLKDKENLTDDCFVYVLDYNQRTNTFHVKGNSQPSSESLMHHLIYKSFKFINAVFHGHNHKIIENSVKLNLTVTRNEFESGTIKLAEEVLKFIGKNKFIVLRNHGFISLGRSMSEAGYLALNILEKSKLQK
jgi:ribulose-5-phosphate 4-epimerase/fuculose-1-phosphate aldolase